MGASARGVPRALVRMIDELGVVHETVLLVSVTTENVPAVEEAERAQVEPCGRGFYRVIMRYGFMEEPRLRRPWSRPRRRTTSRSRRTR
jgi:KUP system potassium uptake protein